MFEDIFDEIKRLKREIDKNFNQFFNNRLDLELEEEMSGMKKPLSEMEETEKDLILRFEIPGVDKKDIHLNITKNKVEIRAEKKKEEKIEKKGFFKSERIYNGFYRTMILPCEVIPEKAKAKYKDGILEVIVPKTKDDKKTKIEIE
ncbi:MAG: Hsp20/alpha crystallin family protein [Candidatus Pacearchaeota archaeon]